MAKYKLTRKAVDDLANIWNYTYDKWSERQADIYYKMLVSSFKEIAKNPNLGKSYDQIIPKLFGFKSIRHIIFYRIKNETEVEILRILHERMDLKNRINE